MQLCPKPFFTMLLATDLVSVEAPASKASLTRTGSPSRAPFSSAEFQPDAEAGKRGPRPREFASRAQSASRQTSSRPQGLQMPHSSVADPTAPMPECHHSKQSEAQSWSPKAGYLLQATTCSLWLERHTSRLAQRGKRKRTFRLNCCMATRALTFQKFDTFSHYPAARHNMPRKASTTPFRKGFFSLSCSFFFVFPFSCCIPKIIINVRRPSHSDIRNNQFFPIPCFSM